MIKLYIGGKEKKVSNKVGIAILRKSNPYEQFRIAKCNQTTPPAEVIQHLEGKNWICLHDNIK